MPDKTEQVTTQPQSRFKIQKLADVDEMKEYRETAELMVPGDLVDNLHPIDASRLAKAIVQFHGERTVRIETVNDGNKRVICVAQRELRPRKAKTAPVPAKKKAEGKTANAQI